MAPRLVTISNTIHLRQFVDDIVADSKNTDNFNRIEIHPNIAIFEGGQFHRPNTMVEAALYTAHL
jgi:hypothetical protein